VVWTRSQRGNHAAQEQGAIQVEKAQYQKSLLPASSALRAKRRYFLDLKGRAGVIFTDSNGPRRFSRALQHFKQSPQIFRRGDALHFSDIRLVLSYLSATCANLRASAALNW
jgi:hypothetical protein